jgi:RHS repeat-associated protein
VYDGTSPATWQAAPVKQFVWGAELDELVSYRRKAPTATVPAWETYYLLHGGQETAAKLVDANGEVVEQYEYDPYGRATVFSKVAGQWTSGGVSRYGLPFLWKAVRLDEVTGLLQMRNRYYSVETGRFLSSDTLGVWADQYNWGNEYAYAGQRPLTLGDPDGLQTATPRPYPPSPCYVCHGPRPLGNSPEFQDFMRRKEEERNKKLWDKPSVPGFRAWNPYSDWCGGENNWTAGATPEINDCVKYCCYLHDACYSKGGTHSDKKSCDDKFGGCISKCGALVIALAYFSAVSVFGHYFFNFHNAETGGVKIRSGGGRGANDYVWVGKTPNPTCRNSEPDCSLSMSRRRSMSRPKCGN